MNLRFTYRADKDYAELPAPVRKAFAKQLGFLLDNLTIPLCTRKIRRGAGRLAGASQSKLAILFLNPQERIRDPIGDPSSKVKIPPALWLATLTVRLNPAIS